MGKTGFFKKIPAVVYGAATMLLSYFSLLALEAMLVCRGVVPQDKTRLLVCAAWLLAAWVGGKIALAAGGHRSLSYCGVGIGGVILFWTLGMIFCQETSFANGGIFFLATAACGNALAMLPYKGRTTHKKRRVGKRLKGRS